MSTRSSIMVRNADGTVTGIYCHFDGYPSHNGRLLVDHYNEEQKVRELVSLGDMSYLAENINPDSSREHKFDGEKQEGVCLFYHRDRGEPWEDTAPKTDSEFGFLHYNEQAYNYLFDNGRWHVKGCGEKTWQELQEED